MSVRRRLFLLFITLLLCVCSAAAWAQDFGQTRTNRVLSLDGDGDYLEIAESESLNIDSQVTMEAWVRFREYTNAWMPVMYKGETNEGKVSYGLFLNRDGFIGLVSAPSGLNNTPLGTFRGLVMSDTWAHIVGVVDGKGKTMKIFVNGTEVAQRDFGGGIHISALPLRIGWWHIENDLASYFAGEMDEIRIWNVARTQRQIREAMHRKLLGTESGLVGYWQFDNIAEPVSNSSPEHLPSKLVGDAHLAEAGLPDAEQLDYPAVLSGIVTDEAGKPLEDASIYLIHDDLEVLQTRTDNAGKYQIALYPVHGQYDVSAVAGDMGYWQLDMQLREGKHRVLDMTLEKAVSIEGRLLMLDDKTPHVAVAVQAVRDEEFATTTLSDNDGRYQFVNLRPGIYSMRCYTLDGYVYYGEEKAGKPVDCHVQRRRTIKNVDFRFAPFKKGIWKTYTYLDGLADNSVLAIHYDRDNILWIGTDVGLSRYDGKEFINFTRKDGLAEEHGWAIYSDSDGVLWIGTDNGVSRYDGRGFVNFNMEDGLVDNRVRAIHSDANGVMWFGTENGVSRYDGKSFTNLTIDDGLPNNYINAIHRDKDGAMWFGTANGLSRYDGKEFINFTTRDGLANNSVRAIYCAPDGLIWFGTNAGVSRYDGKELINFTIQDGLAHNGIHAIYRDSHGSMWFGTSGGVSMYDGTGFINLTIQDGLAHNKVNAVHADPDGATWFATEFGGISKYSESAFNNLTTRDGLVNNFVRSVYIDPAGAIWFGTQGGVSRYDGKEFINFTARDGLADEDVISIYGGPDGVVWFGLRGAVSRYDGERFSNLTQEDGLLSSAEIQAICHDKDGVIWFGGLGGGIYRYDGKKLVNLTEEDGLAGNAVRDIYCDPDGILWVATDGGISRYDGVGFVNITREHGLVDNLVRAIHRDPDGVFWFGTNSGISRYDGEKFTNFTTEDGLAHNRVQFVYRTAGGVLCFATGGGGISLFDGDTWTSLDTRDGLAGDNVSEVLEGADGSLIFATDGGVTQYLRSTNPPGVRVSSILVGKEQYTDLSGVPGIIVGNDVTIECSALDFKTVPEKRQYRYRIREVDQDWRRPTKSPQFEWIPGETGTYTFEVQAIDRDLNYSEPASIELTIVSPAFYAQAGFIIGFGAILLAALVFLATSLFKHRRQVHAYQLAAVQELQDAREMQIALLPEAAPPVEGMEIAGKSITANTVGGDFFDYLELPDGRIGIAIADVSGKGLRAAMNATMANGMMHEVATIEASCGSILSRLNAHLYPLMEKQMFTAFSLAILDRDTGVIQWSNAGQPLPMIKRSDGVSEADGEGELPIGMAPDVAYPDYELRFETGDIVIFYTDGIIEAENEAEEMYGTERLEKALSGIDSAMISNKIIDIILKDVNDFTGSAEQYDDMTIVVIKKL